VVEKMERETGFEPATSSLGDWAHIVNTDFSISGSDFKRRKITEFPTLCFDCLLMEYKWSTNKGDTHSPLKPLLNPAPRLGT
jgi:hypothetical protein